MRGEYRVTICRGARGDFDVYSVDYVRFAEDGTILDIEGGAASLFDTDPGVVAGALLRMHEAFEKPPIDRRGPSPVECTEVLKT